MERPLRQATDREQTRDATPTAENYSMDPFWLTKYAGSNLWRVVMKRERIVGRVSCTRRMIIIIV